MDWRKACIETTGAEMCDTDILASDLNNPQLLDKRQFCSAMCKYITEVTKTNSEDYPPNTVCEIVTSIQMYLKGNQINWKLLNEEDEIFCDLFFVVDNIMKDRLEAGLGVVKSATPIDLSMEEKMWTSGILGEHNPKQLCETVLFLIGINLALRGGEEHKKLRRPGFNPQITVSSDNDGIRVPEIFTRSEE